MVFHDQILGPAYLDRVLRVDRPLLPSAIGGTIDGSFGGRLAAPGDRLLVRDPSGAAIDLDPPPGWPGPTGTIDLDRPLASGAPGGWRNEVKGLTWRDDLGGMGAGFAAALGGRLVHALGADDDPTSLRVGSLLERYEIRSTPIRVPDRPADWTLIVTSGGHGDKLAIGFRGCHQALDATDLPRKPRPAAIRVAAAVANDLMGVWLGTGRCQVRLCAPAMRNMLDRDRPLAAIAGSIDVLACNRREWEALTPPDRKVLADRVPIVSLTDGPSGCRILYRDRDARPVGFAMSAFPRTHPPRDTNRAGEAFAARLVATLVDAEWTRGPFDRDLLEYAALRASAAAALVLDLERFGFPTTAQVDRALAAGVVEGVPPPPVAGDR